MIDLNFYKGKNVFVTGHTGFKGSWLCKILVDAGANVTGYSLEPSEEHKLFELSNIQNKIIHEIGDIRDLKSLKKVFDRSNPEIVFHLAAQPIVRTSYKEPVLTYETNVMGTVNILECVRNSATVKSFLNITTDKVYKNNECKVGYKEDDFLDGYDPYSNSKSCSELITHCYKNSFFTDENKNVAISTARAGNVIGGGDFAKNRIIPDCVRAAVEQKNIIIRNQYSIRPYQHVLESLFAYLLIAQKQCEDKKYSGYYNVGPNDKSCITTGELADIFCKYWGEGIEWKGVCKNGPHEANILKLNCSKIKKTFGWKPTWNIEKAIEKTVEFVKADNKEECMENQIKEFYLECKVKGICKNEKR